MKVVNKLGQLLNIGEDEYGIISNIVKETQLSRHTVREFLHNRAQTVSYEVLAKICQYLIDHEGVDPSILPGALFVFAPNEFWPMLYERRRIEFCMGTRRDPQWYDELVMAADAELQAKLTHRITQYSSLQNGSHDELGARDGQIFDQRLITAPSRDGKNEQETIRQSKAICDQFDAQKNDKALICLGSVKCNSVIERFLSECFADTTPFASQDDVETDRDRTCPFAILFRPSDPPLISCCGGRRLSRENPGSGPGIYFEGPNVEWSHVPSDKCSDGAVVFYRYNKSLCNLRMCLGGYSSRATRFLADFLRSGDADGKLWPPVYDDGEIQIGLYVLQFKLDQEAEELPSGSVRHQKPLDTTVYSVSEEVIQRRVRLSAHKQSKITQVAGQQDTTKPR